MRFYKYLSWVVIGFAIVVALLGSVSVVDAVAVPPASVSQELVPAPAPTPKTAQDPITAAQTGSPNVLEQFGPPGVLITTVLTGVLMIIRSINDGKKIDVTTYKERAAEAESRSNEEIGKVHRKLGELEKKLDDVIADRDEYRDTLEERKAHFTQQILDMERRHQRELEDMHSALLIEVHTRHSLERLLAQNGIPIPNTAPPYTQEMKEAVTLGEVREVRTNTAAMRTIREENEG